MAHENQDQEVMLPYGLPPGMRVMEHQIGGHAIGNGKCKTGILKEKGGRILKPFQRPPFGQRELEFYETVAAEVSDPIVLELRTFLPQFYGSIPLTIDGEEVNFLSLEDVTEGYSKLCVADYKVGQRTWDPEASEEKRRKEEAKYRGTREVFGFCIQGMRIHDVATGKPFTLGRDYGKNLDKHTIRDAFHLFLNGNGGLQTVLAREFLTQLHLILSWFRRQTRFHFYGSSLLMTYDASHFSLCGTNGKIQRPDWPVRVTMIDFAHVFPANGQLDLNYLTGLESMVKIFEEFAMDDGSNVV